jgi:L-tartrate/succinate antiporter
VGNLSGSFCSGAKKTAPKFKKSMEIRTTGREKNSKRWISVREISMALLALLALGLWIFGGDFINATTVALLVLSLMVMTRIVEWDDVLAHKQAWTCSFGSPHW